MMFLNSPMRRLRKDSAPDQDFKAALRARLMHGQTPVVYATRTPVWRYAMATVAVCLVMFFSLSSYAYASSAVSEGTALYPLKTGIEDLEGQLQRTPEAQARFRVKIMSRRVREITYRLRHHKPLPPGVIAHLAQEMDLTVAGLRDAKEDPEIREEALDQLKEDAVEFLTELRVQVSLADISEENKQRYYKAIDIRLDRLD